MATKKCSACGKRIKLNETDCPYCGAFVYNYKDVYSDNDNCEHITSQPTNSCSHETYTKDTSYNKQISVTRKPVSYSKKVSYVKQTADQQKAMAVIALVFSFFGLFGNVVFSFISLGFIKVLQRTLPENSELLKTVKTAKALNTVAFTLFGIMIGVTIIGALVAEFGSSLFTEEIFEMFLN